MTFLMGSVGMRVTFWDSWGTRGGLARDSRGTRGLFGGFALKSHDFPLGFWGTRVRPLPLFYNIKILYWPWTNAWMWTDALGSRWDGESTGRPF